MSLTCLPPQVSQGLRVLGPCFRHRHQLVFSWLLVLHIIYGERANLQALARHGVGRDKARCLGRLTGRRQTARFLIPPVATVRAAFTAHGDPRRGFLAFVFR
jgi:hypothetical protein